MNEMEERRAVTITIGEKECGCGRGILIAVNWGEGKAQPDYQGTATGALVEAFLDGVRLFAQARGIGFMEGAGPMTRQ